VHWKGYAGRTGGKGRALGWEGAVQLQQWWLVVMWRSWLGLCLARNCFCTCSHREHALVPSTEDGEDMLAGGRRDDCARFVKYYAIRCVQVDRKLMVFTECWQ